MDRRAFLALAGAAVAAAAAPTLPEAWAVHPAPPHWVVTRYEDRGHVFFRYDLEP